MWIVLTVLVFGLSNHLLFRWRSVPWCMLPWLTTTVWLMEEKQSLSCARSSQWWRTPGCCSLTCEPLCTPGPTENKPPYTNSGYSNLMNITVTEVDVLLYWFFSSEPIQPFERPAQFEPLVCKAGSDKRCAAVVEKCLGLGFLWCWSLDHKKKRYIVICVRHMSFSTYNINIFHLLWDQYKYRRAASQLIILVEKRTMAIYWARNTIF